MAVMKERFVIVLVASLTWAPLAWAKGGTGRGAWVDWARPALDEALERAVLLARVGRCRRAWALLERTGPVFLDSDRLVKVVAAAWLCGTPRLAASWLQRRGSLPMQFLGDAGQAGWAWAEAAVAAGWWRLAASWFLGVTWRKVPRKLDPPARALLVARGLEILLAHGRISTAAGHLAGLPEEAWNVPQVDLVAAVVLFLTGRGAVGEYLLQRVCAQRSLEWLGGLHGLGPGCRGFYRWLLRRGCGCRPIRQPGGCALGASLSVPRPSKPRPICRVLDSAGNGA